MHGDRRTLQLEGERDPSGTIGLTESAVTALCAHSWPGNFRELEAVLERALMLYLGDADALVAEHVQLALRGTSQAGPELSSRRP